MDIEEDPDQTPNLGAADIDADSLEDVSKLDLISALDELAADGDLTTTELLSEARASSSDASPTDTAITDSSEEGLDSSRIASSEDFDHILSADKSSDDIISEAGESYLIPSGLDIQPGTTVLVEYGSHDDEKVPMRHNLLSTSEATDPNVLLIQYRPMQTDEIQRVANNSQYIKIITIGYTQSVPQSVEDAVETVEVDDPSDVTRLGILATGILGEWSSFDAQTVVSVDRLEVMFQYKTSEATFRFLHIFLRKLSAQNSISSFFIDASCIDTQAVNTIKPLFNEVVSVHSTGIDVE